jgi:large subunit ribosomal protein L9
MQVILLKDVDNLGSEGSIVEVKPGYARNFLLPQEMARFADKKNKRQLAHFQKIAGFVAAKAKQAAEAARLKLAKVKLRIACKVGEQDKLFGSVTAQQVQAALKEQGVDVDRRKIELSEPIKTLGNHTVNVRLSAGLSAEIKLEVVAE